MIILYVILVIVILFFLLKCLSLILEVVNDILNFLIWIKEHIEKMCTWFKRRISKTRTSPAENNKADAEPEEYLCFIVCK